MVLSFVLALALSQTSPSAPRKTRPLPHGAQTSTQAAVPSPPDPLKSPLAPSAQKALQTQVMLDRAGFSPGEIDASMGSNTRRALDAFEKNGGSPSSLPADALALYRITADDAAGPFIAEIPSDLEAQAKLPALGYRNILEALGERFHSSPTLLKKLNRRSRFQAGDDIHVPNVLDAVQPVPPPRGAKQTADPSAPANVTVTVSRSDSTLTIVDGAGHVLFFAPVTTGSEHDPLPIGEWKVNGVQRNPAFHYNPELFWDAAPTKAKATIPPGPNNPVGVVWVDISRPHYGLHGTPEPGKIGKTASHGCVRLTNWDALKVASLVHTGTRVVFQP